MHKKGELFVQSLLLIWLGLVCRLVSAQSRSCPLITINDLGSTTEFSSEGLVSQGIVPPGESNPMIPVRIRTFTIVCDASGNRTNTSSFVSVVVEFQCDFQSTTTSLMVCSDPNNIVTRQYQFECTEQGGQPVWDASVSGSNSNVQTISPTATLSTPLVNQCRRCIDDQQSSRADPTTHCDPCPSRCDPGQGRCYLGQLTDVCCSFYLEGNCRVEDCPSPLVADSNFDCVCPVLTLVNGAVSYSIENSNVVRDVGSVATHTCNTGFRLIPQGMGDTRTCNTSGWRDPVFMCEQIVCPDLNILNGVVRISPPGRLLNSRTEYICDPDFALKGDGNRICQEDSTWNGTNPECADCSPALQDSNCEECGFDSNNLPICTTCRVGYRVVDGQCANEVIQCPELSIKNGKVIVTPTDRTVNSTAEYTCDDSYKLDKGDAKRTCRNGGTWSGETPECSKEGLKTGTIVGIAVAVAVAVAVCIIIIVLIIIVTALLMKSNKNKTGTQSEKDHQLDEKMVED